MGSPAPLRRRRAALVAAVAVALTLAVLAACELVLRAAGIGPPPLYKLDSRLSDQAASAIPDADLIYRLTPRSTLLGRYHMNALGYRGPEVARERAPGTLRVVCTGDSSTFGLGVAQDEAWPFVLGRLLRAALDARGDPRTVEIVDAGVPGYTTLQNRIQIERDLIPLHPDVIVWCPMGHNDAAREQPPDDLARWQRRQGVLGWLRRTSVASALDAIATRLRGADASTVPRVSLARLEENLRAGAAIARAAGVPLILIAPPHDRRVRDERPDEFAAEERVVAVARAERIPLADPRAAIDALAARNPFPDGVHPDAAAQARIAESALDALSRAYPALLARGATAGATSATAPAGP